MSGVVNEGFYCNLIACRVILFAPGAYSLRLAILSSEQ